MKVVVEYEVKNCRECCYSSNSSQEHDCSFTSAPYPTIWYCNHPKRRAPCEERYISDEYKIDEYCPIQKAGDE